MSKFKYDKTSKTGRLNIVNRIIEEMIAMGGRRGPKDDVFFYSKENKHGRETKASMVIRNNKVYFIDDYTESRIYPYSISSWRGFSHGGTLRALVMDFREFIITGEYTNGNNGYGGLYCPHWGHPAEKQEKVIKVAEEIGYL